MLLCGARVLAQAPETLIVGGDAAYPPFEWRAPGGPPRGFNIELMRLLARPDGVELEFRLGPWAETLEALDRGELDVVPMFVSESRRQRYYFTNIYFYQTHALFGRPGLLPVDDVSDVADLDVVVEARSFAAGELSALDASADPRLSSNTREALRMVAEDEADYALLASPVARELIRSNDWDIEMKSPPFWPRGYAFAVLRDRPALADWLQARLVEVMSNGEYLELYEQWSDRIEPGSDYSAEYVRVIQSIALLMVAIVAAVAAWNYSLRRQVAHRTRVLDEELGHRKAAEERARESARRDSITGLANVRYFCKRVTERLERQPREQPAEVMLIRLMELESIIRSFGYGIAERMVVGFAQALAESFSEAVAHLGRGTFAVFSDDAGAHERLDQLEAAVNKGESLIRPRFVAGSAFYPDDDDDLEGLLQKAELALAESQTTHCRWTRYNSELQSDPVDIQLVEHVRAGRLDGIDFVAQAQLRLRDRALVACELLARWNHPEFGEVTPARFVPLLENAGLIAGLTERALNASLALAPRLKSESCPAVVSVNISTRDLIDPDFARRVSDMLRHSAVDGAQLKMEITETSLVRDPEAVRETLEKLAGMGVTISLDDFGTGYSSLDYISRFPISEVKIDRSFVIRMTESDRDLSIVRSTIAMAHEMGMSVVGEGAETGAHVETLAELGCDLAQGWAIGYPVSADSLVASVQDSVLTRQPSRT